MILFKIYRTVFDTGNPENTTHPTIEPLKDYNLEIRDGKGRIVVSTVSPENTTNVLFLPFSGQDALCDYQQKDNVFVFNPHFRYMDETAGITVEVSNADKRFNLLPYTADFSIYGYDLELSIILVDTDHSAYPFSSCQVYRKPFTNQVNVLNTISSNIGKRIYKIETVENNSTVSTVVETPQNFAIYSNSLEHNLSVTGSSSKTVRTGCKHNPVADNPNVLLITNPLGSVSKAKWIPDVELFLDDYSFMDGRGAKNISMELDFRDVIVSYIDLVPNYLCKYIGTKLSYINKNNAVMQTKCTLHKFSPVDSVGKKIVLLDTLPFSDTIASSVRMEFLLFGRESTHIAPPYYEGTAQVTGNYIVYKNQKYFAGDILDFDKTFVIHYEDNGSLQPVVWTDYNKWYRYPATNEIFWGTVYPKGIVIEPKFKIVKELKILNHGS